MIRRNNATAIKKVRDEHQYSINTIIVEGTGTFKRHASLWKEGFAKQDGYGVAEILALMIMLLLLWLNSVHSLYPSACQKVTTVKRDARYRLKNHEKMPWRRILYGVATRFQMLTNSDKIVADTEAVTLDDNPASWARRHFANVSSSFGHGALDNPIRVSRPRAKLLCWKKFYPTDFRMHAEKRPRGKPGKAQDKKSCVPARKHPAKRTSQGQNHAIDDGDQTGSPTRLSGAGRADRSGVERCKAHSGDAVDEKPRCAWRVACAKTNVRILTQDKSWTPRRCSWREHRRPREALPDTPHPLC